MEGERTRASARPRPRYLRPLAGSLDGSEPQRAAGTENGSRAGCQVLQGPRWSRLPALVSLCVSRSRHDLHKPRLTPDRLRFDWLHWGGVAGGISGGYRVASEGRLPERAQPALTLLESRGWGRAVPPSVSRPESQTPGHRLG